VNGFQDIELYCTLTNNNRRGTTPVSVNAADGSTSAGGARPPVDAANSRASNVHGGVIRWREDGRSVRATTFTWDTFVQAGDTQTTKAALPTNDFKGDIVDNPNGSADYGAPDGLWFDDFGRMWVQTDSGDGTGDFVNLGMDQMVCVDPSTKETKRFLTACPRAEVTGVTMSPDGKTMWVGLQHPGDDATDANPEVFSRWPHSQWNLASDGVTPLNPGRPRSGVVVITKDDGGIIGT
jgi:secreted PhoX family phosphatase